MSNTQTNNLIFSSGGYTATTQSYNTNGNTLKTLTQNNNYIIPGTLRQSTQSYNTGGDTLRTLTQNNNYIIPGTLRQATQSYNTGGDTLRTLTQNNNYIIPVNNDRLGYAPVARCHECNAHVKDQSEDEHIKCLRCKRYFCQKCNNIGTKCKKGNINIIYQESNYNHCGACRRDSESRVYFDYSKCNLCQYEIKYISIEDKYKCLLENCEMTDEMVLKMTQDKYTKLQKNGSSIKPALKK
jgi:hypothetical protein